MTDFPPPLDRQLHQASAEARERRAGFAAPTRPRPAALEAANARRNSSRAILRRRLRHAPLIGALALVLVGLWRSGPATMPPGAPAPEWTIALSSSGSAPVSALVFGKEAGIHVVRIPGSTAPPDEQRRVIARLARGEVYMVSMGSRGLRVSSKGPPGSGVISMRATGRFVKLYQRPGATGISTGWW